MKIKVVAPTLSVDWKIYPVFPHISSEQLCFSLWDCAALPCHRDHPSMCHDKKRNLLHVRIEI